jgi:hypothetical protein
MESCINLHDCSKTTMTIMMMAVVAMTKSPATITNKQITKGLYYFKIYYHITFLNSPLLQLQMIAQLPCLALLMV